jgi:hypothetical protein
MPRVPSEGAVDDERVPLLAPAPAPATALVLVLVLVLTLVLVRDECRFVGRSVFVS